MAHPRIEEVDDSDMDVDDPSEDDIDDFAEADILRRVEPKSASSALQPAQPPPPDARSHILPPSQLPFQPSSSQQQQAQQQQYQTTTNAAAYAHFQMLYPVYFDARRSRADGRRVSSALAVPNPLAHDIAAACAALAVPFVFEPAKLHPRDWANPGRVRVGLKAGGGGGGKGAAAAAMKTQKHPTVQNKHHLYVLVAQHLQAHPTTDCSAGLSVRLPGAPPPPDLRGDGAAWPRPAVPRGWKMGELLPYYSPAMTGGGVSENLFKDMMKEMQGTGGPGGVGGPDMAGLLAGAGGGQGSGAEDKKKKDKKGRGKGKA